MAGIQVFRSAPQSPNWAFPVGVPSSSWIGTWIEILSSRPLCTFTAGSLPRKATKRRARPLCSQVSCTPQAKAEYLRLTVSASTIGTADEQTQATWRVEILASELAELGSRGVEIIEYDTPGLKTENGIADTGDALHAWFMDPARNTLGIDQYK